MWICARFRRTVAFVFPLFLCIDHVPSSAPFCNEQYVRKRIVDAGLYALDGNPKSVEEALDRMQFYQHSRHRRPSHHVAVRQVAEDDDRAVESGRDRDGESCEMQEMKRRISQLEEALEERRTPAKPENSEIQDLTSRIYELGCAPLTCSVHVPDKFSRNANGAHRTMTMAASL